jgi:hypothetical protein
VASASGAPPKKKQKELIISNVVALDTFDHEIRKYIPMVLGQAKH